MRIYTRTGDDGTTGLYGGGRVSKTSTRIQALGDVDELNSALGFARSKAVGLGLFEELGRIQHWLFDMGAEIGALGDASAGLRSISEAQVEWLERSIDAMTAKLPPLRAFILPGGSELAAALHLARSVCRRAERSVLALHEEAPVREVVLKLLNRLSDWLFTAARTGNFDQGVLDTVWQASEEH